MIEKKTLNEWADLENIEILDPDGFDRTDALNRLAAYEDSGLSPEEVQAQRQEIDRLKRRERIGEDMATKPDCIYYDWGDTAPREYGAFCKKTESCLNKNTCENCNSYFKRIDGDMERLTTRTRYGCKFIGLPPYSNRPEKNKLLSNAANKLAAYEDTGLTPERIRELQNAFNILFESERQKQQENEQLQAQLESLRCTSCGEIPATIGTDDGQYEEAEKALQEGSACTVK